MNKMIIALVGSILVMGTPLISAPQRGTRQRAKIQKVAPKRNRAAARPQMRGALQARRGQNRRNMANRAVRAPRAGNRNMRMVGRAAIAANRTRRPQGAARRNAVVARPVPAAIQAPRPQARPVQPRPAVQNRNEAPQQNQPNTGIIAQHDEVRVYQTRITVVRGDITRQRVDAIVNAANEQLAAGGGVCGAIFSAAGRDELQRACNQFPSHLNERCRTGQAKITPSFNLRNAGISHIIHAAGPDCRYWTDPDDRRLLLKQAYTNSLRLAIANNLRTICFPFISTGIYEYPKADAAQEALDAVAEFARDNRDALAEIRFAVLSDADYQHIATALAAAPGRLVNYN